MTARAEVRASRTGESAAIWDALAKGRRWRANCGRWRIVVAPVARQRAPTNSGVFRQRVIGQSPPSLRPPADALQVQFELHAVNDVGQ